LIIAQEAHQGQTEKKSDYRNGGLTTAESKTASA